MQSRLIETPVISSEETARLMESIGLTRVEADMSNYDSNSILVCVMDETMKNGTDNPLRARANVALIPEHDSLGFHGRFGINHSGYTDYFAIPRENLKITHIRTSYHESEQDRTVRKGNLFLASPEQANAYFLLDEIYLSEIQRPTAHRRLTRIFLID